MKLCVISDIHSNIFYLEKCMNRIIELGFDKLICLGDTVGYFNNPNEVIDMLISEKAEFLLGNHEAMLLEVLDCPDESRNIYNIDKHLAHINKEHLEFMSTWIPFYEMELNEKRFLFIHGSPYNPLCGYIYENTITPMYDCLNYDFIFFGHTHIPFIRNNKRNTMVNAGSCGLPRDYGNKPSFVMVDCESFKIDIVRLDVNIDEFIHHVDVHVDVTKCLRR